MTCIVNLDNNNDSYENTLDVLIFNYAAQNGMETPQFLVVSMQTYSEIKWQMSFSLENHRFEGSAFETYKGIPFAICNSVKIGYVQAV